MQVTALGRVEKPTNAAKDTLPVLQVMGREDRLVLRLASQSPKSSGGKSQQDLEKLSNLLAQSVSRDTLVAVLDVTPTKKGKGMIYRSVLISLRKNISDATPERVKK